MLDQHTRTRIWLADLEAINAHIEENGMPAPAPRTTRKRSRKLKPLWEH